MECAKAELDQTIRVIGMLQLTEKEKAVAALYADFHGYATDSFAVDQLLPRFVRHLLRDVGLDPADALRGKSFLDAGCGGFAGGVACARVLGAEKITGIDLSHENVLAARQRFLSCQNVSFQQESRAA